MWKKNQIFSILEIKKKNFIIKSSGEFGTRRPDRMVRIFLFSHGIFLRFFLFYFSLFYGSLCLEHFSDGIVVHAWCSWTKLALDRSFDEQSRVESPRDMVKTWKYSLSAQNSLKIWSFVRHIGKNYLPNAPSIQLAMHFRRNVFFSALFSEKYEQLIKVVQHGFCFLFSWETLRLFVFGSRIVAIHVSGYESCLQLRAASSGEKIAEICSSSAQSFSSVLASNPSI